MTHRLHYILYFSANQFSSISTLNVYTVKEFPGFAYNVVYGVFTNVKN